MTYSWRAPAITPLSTANTSRPMATLSLVLCFVLPPLFLLFVIKCVFYFMDHYKDDDDGYDDDDVYDDWREDLL